MKATVREVHSSGLVVNIVRGGTKANAWLPSSEWSQNNSDWENAVLTLEPGFELDVLETSGSKSGQLVVSRKRVFLTSRDCSWSGEIREMVIDDVGRNIIRGKIGANLPAIVDCEAYLDWLGTKRLQRDWLDHSVLSRGDCIRGFVHSDSAEGHSLKLDLCEYLDLRGQELSRAVRASDLTEESEQKNLNRELPHLRAELRASISPALLADDNQKCRNSVAGLLRRGNIAVNMIGSAKEADAFLAGLGAAPNQIKLAIIDPNLEDDNSDKLTGLKVANALISKGGCRVIIITGEISNANKLKAWGDLRIHGFIQKPFTTDRLLEAIQEAHALDQPIPLKDWITTEDGAQSLEPPGVRESELSLGGILQQLGRLKGGSVLHIFQVHPRSFRARSLALSGEGLKWEPLSGKIAKSVIKDAAFSREPILEGDAVGKPNHLWTQKMMEYRSFCGIPIYVQGQKLALTAFHRQPNMFDESFLTAATLAAEQAGRAVERQMLRDSRGNEASLASYGMALATMAHELASELTALSATVQELDDLLVESAEFRDWKEKGRACLERTQRTVLEISEKTLILRGIHARTAPVSPLYCLRKAAIACRKFVADTFQHPEKFAIDPVSAIGELNQVAVPAASLIIVFFNLYLNAMQQMELMSSVRQYGRAWHSADQYIDANGRAWLRVRIHDSGPGIHRDDWERVFDPGYSTKPNGSGLGLYICRHLLQSVGAHIAITSSAIWDGSTFTVSLPLQSSNFGRIQR